jgi:CRISPR system Cascade subunit CasE
MTELYLSRASLRRDAPVAALASLLVPDDANARVSASHRLTWSLFSEGPDQPRDFLWREMRAGEFLALSPRPPNDAGHLFEVESKPFAPSLAIGDRLRFSLRCCATVSRSVEHGIRGRRHDVVMDALFNVPREQRAQARDLAEQTASSDWLARQGNRSGFELCGIVVDGYDRVTLPRATGKPAVFGVLDLSGALEVTDPDCFLTKLSRGFGKAKAFGCGLMLIKRP